MAAAAERGFPAVTEAAVRASRCCRGRCSPVGAEQIYNEALVVGLVDTGVGMDAERGYVWGGEALGGVVVGTEAAAERVRGALADEARRRRNGGCGRGLWVTNELTRLRH